MTIDFEAKQACRKTGLSFGSIMLIVLAILFVLYFLIGIPVCKFALKKKGKEIIPFVYFWLSIPGLVVDGVKFIFTPCCRGNRREYEDIKDGE